MAKSDIKRGSGSDVRSPVYAEMGSLRAARGKTVGLGRKSPLRGEKQRSKGGSR